MKFHKRLIGLLFYPKQEWELINKEQGNFAYLVKNFLLYLIILTTTISIVALFFTESNMDLVVRKIVNLLEMALLKFLFVYLSALVINFLAKFFKTDRNLENALKVITYSQVYLLLAVFIEHIPLRYVNIFALIYLAFQRYYGLKIVMKSKRFTVIYALFPDLLVILISLGVIHFGQQLQQMIRP